MATHPNRPPGQLSTLTYPVLCLFALVLWVNSLNAAPFNGERFTYTQPDGSSFVVRIHGDEFFAYQETEEGYLVTRDPRTGFFCYAKVIPNGQDLISTGVRVGQNPPAGLKPKQRLAPGAAFEKSRKLRDILMRTEDGRIDLQRLQQLDIETRRKAGKPLLKEAADAEPDANPVEESSIQFAPAPGEESGTPLQPAPEGAAEPPVAYAPPATITTRTGLVLLASFPDRPGDINKTRAQIDAFCNAPTYTGDGNAASIYEYFMIQSNGRLVYKNIVTAWYTAANNRAYYTDETQGPTVRAKELMIEGLEILKADGFDFTQCDDNNDNTIDGVSVFYAGATVNAWSKGLWPHMAGASWTGFADQGMNTSFTYQFSDMPASLPIFTFCHESGHMILNYPDLYQYDGNAAAMQYCLMGSNTPKHPRHISSYLKIQSGWAEVVDLDSTSHQRCVLQEDLNFFYRYKNPSNAGESFLFEVRGANGYEGPYGGASSTNPTSGIAAYHALDSGTNTKSSIFTADNPNCDYSKPYKLLLIEAYTANNGTTPWYDNPLLESNDGFGAVKKEISDSTTPALKFWNTTTGRTVTSNAHVHSISAPGETMSFIIGTGTTLTNDPEIGITCGSLAWVIDQGNNAPAQSFSIFNAGSGTITYSITDDMSWLSVNLASGDVTAEVDTITVNFSTSGLAAGSYSGTITVTATGIANSPVTIPVTLQVNSALVAPSITLQPVGATIDAGSSHNLTASATGNPAVGYQWYRNGARIAGGNDGSLNFASASVSDSGDYHAVISNLAGSVTTNTVTLTVNPVNEPPTVSWITPLANHIAVPSNVGLWLEGNISDDGFGGGGLTITWSKVSGPGGGVVTWDNTNTGKTAAFFNMDGNYQLRMTATDGTHSIQKDFFVKVGGTPTTVANTDLLIHYDFNASSGTVADNLQPTDAYGKTLDGTLVGNANFSSGVIDFDGAGDYVSIPSSQSYDTWGVVYPKRTVSLWFQADKVTGRQCLFEEGDNARGLSIYLDGSILYCYGYNYGDHGWTSTTLSTGGLTTGTWNQVTVVLDATSGSTNLEANVFHLYLNGALMASGSGAPLKGHGTGTAVGGANGWVSFHDGALANTAYFDGRIEDFRLYNRALNATEIQSLARLQGVEVDAGADVSGNVGTAIALDGTVSPANLPDWATVSTLWLKHSGPATPSFGNAGNVDTTVTTSTAGTYQLRLTADTGQIRTVDGCALTANYVNYAPTWTSSPVNEADASKNAAYSSSLADNATDANGDSLTFAKVSGPTWLSVASNGGLSGTPGTSDVGANAFVVSVSDSIASAVEVTLNITVLNNNNPPVFGSDPITGGNATEDSAYSGSLAGSATDADADTLSYAKTNGPAWLTIATNGSLSGTPTNSDVGANIFTVSVSDGQGGSDSATLNITVINTNDTPVFTANPIIGGNATKEVAYSGSIAGSATDDDNNPLTYAKVSGPNWLSVAANGTLSGTPTAGDVGANVFTVSVTDSIAAPVTATLNITVTAIAGQLGILDVTANGGINPATGNPWQIGDKYRLLFITSTTTTANSENITDYNNFVQAAASGSTAHTNLGSVTWKAAGSTSTVDARDNTGTNPTTNGTGVAVFLMNSQVFAINNADLWNGHNGVLPVIDENDATTTATYAWTGSQQSGVKMSDTNYLGLSATGNTQRGSPSNTTASRWMSINSASNRSNLYPMYAISEELSIVGGSSDTTAPTLASTDIVDDRSGANVDIGTTVTYTVTFSEDMDETTVTAADFGNAGTSSVSIGTVSESSPGVFLVPVTPTSSGSLQLQVNASAVLDDAAGNALDTTTAIVDGTTITVLTEYETWAGGGGSAFDADGNGDGISDGMAWLLGTSAVGTNARSRLPTASNPSGAGLRLQFSMLNASSRGNAILTLEFSNDLGVADPWTSHRVVVPDVSSTVGEVVFVITPNGSFNEIVATIPASAAAGSGRLFSRLAAEP